MKQKGVDDVGAAFSVPARAGHGGTGRGVLVWPDVLRRIRDRAVAGQVLRHERDRGSAMSTARRACSDRELTALAEAVDVLESKPDPWWTEFVYATAIVGPMFVFVAADYVGVMP